MISSIWLATALIGGLLFAEPSKEDALVPDHIPAEHSALPSLTASLRSKTRKLGLNDQPGLGGERVSRALVLLPKDRAKAGVVAFQIEEGRATGAYECETLGRGSTSLTKTEGWTESKIDGTPIWYAPQNVRDGSTMTGIYDARVISSATYEIEFLGSPEGLKDEQPLVDSVRGPEEALASKLYFSGVWKTWFPKDRRVSPIDLLWSERYQPQSQGASDPVFERRPEAKDERQKAFIEKQVAHNPRYYFGPFGRSGLANHTDRWDDADRRKDPHYAGRHELTDFRWRDTDGCLKVRQDCLELLDAFVAEQTRKGRRVQYEIREDPRLDAVPNGR